MTETALFQPEPAPIVACTVSRGIQHFEALIDAMEIELGEAWGDLTFQDALVFFEQPEAEQLDFICLAVSQEDEHDLSLIAAIIRRANSKQIKTILVGKSISSITLHQLMRLGVEDFIPYPLPETMLHQAIARLDKADAAGRLSSQVTTSDTPQALEPPGPCNGVVLAVHGLAGGSGATTFASNLAWELTQIDTQTPLKVCLIDLDFQYGSVSSYLNLPRHEAIFDLLTEEGAITKDRFFNSLQVYNERLHVFSAPIDMLPLDIISGEDIQRLLNIACAHFDLVIVDMPTAITSWTESVLAQAYIYFTLFELDLRSAQNLLRFVRALKAEGLPYEKLHYVLNRAPHFMDLSGKSRAKKMSESLDITIELQLPDGGHHVTQANDHGQPLALSAPRNALRKEIQKLAYSLHALNITANRQTAH